MERAKTEIVRNGMGGHRRLLSETSLKLSNANRLVQSLAASDWLLTKFHLKAFDEIARQRFEIVRCQSKTRQTLPRLLERDVQSPARSASYDRKRRSLTTPCFRGFGRIRAVSVSRRRTSKVDTSVVIFDRFRSSRIKKLSILSCENTTLFGTFSRRESTRTYFLPENCQKKATMNDSTSFAARKRNLTFSHKIQNEQKLFSEDRSRKGSVDAPIEALITEMNDETALLTTSSCSGRTTLFTELEASGKSSVEWIYSTHQLPNLSELSFAVQKFLTTSTKSRKICFMSENVRLEGLVLRFEPFIVACECETLDVAKKLVHVGLEAGFRESGIVIGKHKIHVTVRSASKLEIPICHNGTMLVPESYLEYCFTLAKEKFEKNAEKINRFRSLFRKSFHSESSILPSDSNSSILELYMSTLEFESLTSKARRLFDVFVVAVHF